MKRITMPATTLITTLATALLLSAAITMPASAFDFSSLGKLGDIGTLKRYAGSGAKAVSSLRKGIEDLLPEEEYYIGRSVTARVLADYKPINHRKINAYINEVGGYLAQFSTRPETYGGYHFQLVRSNEINAFAAPGGFIVITSGLYKTLKNEDQLAAVLAHEIAHVTLRHGLGAIKTSNLTEAFTLIGSAAIEGYGKGQQLRQIRQLTGVFSTSVDDVINQLVVSGYSQEQELDADAEGLRIVYRSGYDTAGLGQFLQALQQRSSGVSGGFYSTHPPASNRLSGVNSVLSSEGLQGQPNADRDRRFRRYALK